MCRSFLGSAICANVAAADIATAKISCLIQFAAYNELIAVDGVPSVDFGVSEEANSTKTPVHLVISSPRVLSRRSRREWAPLPTVWWLRLRPLQRSIRHPIRPKASAARTGQAFAKLHGRWYNAFTTAADAFSADSKRGDAARFERSRRLKGRMTNIIEFFPKDHPAFVATRRRQSPRPFKA